MVLAPAQADLLEVLPDARVPEFQIFDYSSSERTGLRELWSYRGLLYFLVWRDVKVRYAQTVLGAAWAILQPVLTTVAFSAIFGGLAHMPSDGVPYPLFSLAGLVLWTYFATAVSAASNSLVGSTNLFTKVYFPRLLISIAPVVAGLVDLLVAFVILVGVMLVYGRPPSLMGLIFLPVVLLTTSLLAAGVGSWLAALNLRYRDVKYVVPFLLQIWMLASPVIYPMSVLPQRLGHIYVFNPMTGAIEGFRDLLLMGPGQLHWAAMGLSASIGAGAFIAGVAYFRSVEQDFADIA